MEITEEFLRSEIADLEREMKNAQEFLIKAQAAIDVHGMLLRKLAEKEPEHGDLSTPPDARNEGSNL